MKTEKIIMEILAKKYIKICEENNMCFPDYQDTCKEEAVKEITKKQIRNFLKSRGAVKYKHYAVPQHNDTFSDLHPRGQYWIIRNFDKWRSASIQDLRDHFNDPLLNLRKAKDKKNHQSILDSGYRSDSDRKQGNALYDKLIEETKIKNSPLLNKIMKG